MLSPFLYTGLTMGYLNLSGQMPDCNDELSMYVSGLLISVAQLFMILLDILEPVRVFWFKRLYCIYYVSFCNQDDFHLSKFNWIGFFQ